MAKGTDFGGIHSYRHLNLIQQKVEIQPAEPKLNMVDIPGADGTKDLSDRPAGRIVYKDRTITWTFALYPGENWNAKHRQVSNALNGKACRITLDGDPDYYYQGRLTVKKYQVDKALRQITVAATCFPYMLKQKVTTVEANLTTDYTTIILLNDRKPTIPSFTVPTAASIKWGDYVLSLDGGGTFRSLDIELQEGENVLQAKLSSGPGKMVITYQEGSL